ncbi:hypothetical protein F5144DRAFT_586125 [Chaetomium tenue]|uniref:Uncharacterized protein n=1 Tax=Chaetomium tenue TaxID=1854479 RepID=A0ACB7NV90_9PEZI|nr:hypothetical protein F5144DRAFT_586125 [Chaetomium globosum]
MCAQAPRLVSILKNDAAAGLLMAVMMVMMVVVMMKMMMILKFVAFFGFPRFMRQVGRTAFSWNSRSCQASFLSWPWPPASKGLVVVNAIEALMGPPVMIIVYNLVTAVPSTRSIYILLCEVV